MQSPKFIAVCFSFFVLISSLSFSSFADVKSQQQKNQRAQHVPNRIIVKFKEKVPSTIKRLSHFSVGAQLDKKFKHFQDIQALTIPDTMSMDEALAAYAKDPNVEFAEPDYIYHTALTPDDSRFDELWALNNTGQTDGVFDADINATEAWDITTGSHDVIVAVIDTGVDYTHPDLADNMWVNPGEIAGNNIDDDANGYIDDVHGINATAIYSSDNPGDPMDDVGHGTHVSGTIAAKSNNSSGVSGINWDIQVIACKFISSYGYGTSSDAIECLDYLLDLKTRATNPVDIILSNNSWGGGDYSQALFNAIKKSRDAGILFVAAAGNEYSNNDLGNTYPSDFELSNIISVAATDHNDALIDFSNYGRRSVDVGAPGGAILSTVPTGYFSASGTSMAAPHVAGLAALIKANDPTRNWTEIKNLLISSGESIPALSTKTISGKRIRAADVGGVGALTCNEQVVNQRVLPVSNTLSVNLGEAIILVSQNINCAAANGDVNVIVNGDNMLTLTDDGLGADEMAGDGLYSVEYIPETAGAVTLTFPDADDVTLNVVSASVNYQQPTLTSFNYRTITGTPLNMGLNTVRTITSPFPIQYADSTSGFTTLYISSNGLISLSNTNIDSYNETLPYTTHEYVIAPFWDGLDARKGDDVYWEVQGTAPNRELIIEWRDIPHFPYYESVTFQVVFIEGSSDVLFNYADVNFGNRFYDFGASATIGLQVSSNTAQQYSFNSPVLTDAMSLLWVYATLKANAGLDQVVNPDLLVGLDGSESSVSSGTIESYSWSQTAGIPVNLNDATTATPSFISPIEGGLTFELTVTNDIGDTSTDLVSITVNTAPVSNAGQNRDGLVNTRIALNGTGSSDSDGHVSKFSWIQTAGNEVSIANSSTTAPSFTAPLVSDVLSFELAVMDNRGLVTTDIVNVTIDGPPTADAGEDQPATLNTTVTLDGSGSFDTVGNIISYNWVQTAGTTVDVTDANTITPSFTTSSIIEMLTFELTIVDNAGFTATDTVVITVEKAPQGGGGGGCTMSNRPVAFDPLFPVLLLLAMLRIIRGRYNKNCNDGMKH